MKTFTIQIKNMVCPRCIHVVKQILTDLGVKYEEVDLGYAVLASDQPLDLDELNERLEVLELGLVRDTNEELVTKINAAIYDYLENISRLSQTLKLSEYISQQVARNYHQLSKVYSQYSGETIEQHFIELRTNKVKELVKQGKLNLSQIAVDVGYSSIHYLSGQFKKFTGMSLSEYKKQWEYSLQKTSNNGRTKKDQESADIEESECGCGCQDCDCGGRSDSGGGEFNPPSGRNGDSGSSMYSMHYFQNFGEYRVHVSA